VHESDFILEATPRKRAKPQSSSEVSGQLWKNKKTTQGKSLFRIAFCKRSPQKHLFVFVVSNLLLKTFVPMGAAFDIVLWLIGFVKAQRRQMYRHGIQLGKETVMCKVKSREPVKMLPTAIKAVVLGLLCALSAQIASAANLCIQCPVDAQGPAVGGAFDVYLNAGGGVRGRRVTGDMIGRCQTNLLLVAQVSYNQFATGGGVGAGFTGGDYRWTLIARGAASVFEAVPGEPTPADMAMTLVTDINKPCATPVPAGFTTVGQKEMIDIPYTVTAADANSGFLQWLFDASTRPSALLTNLLGNCVETVPGRYAERSHRTSDDLLGHPRPACLCRQSGQFHSQWCPARKRPVYIRLEERVSWSWGCLVY